MFLFRRKRKKTKTLKRELRYWLLAFVGLLVIVYTIGLFSYLVAGLKLSNKVELKSFILAYEKALEKQPADLPPEDARIFSTFKYEDLPEMVKKAFPKDEIELGHADIEPVGESGRAPEFVIFFLAERLSDGRTLYVVRMLKFNEDLDTGGILDFDFLERVMFVGGATILVLVFLLSQFLNQRINRRIAALQEWADTLNETSAVERRPDFHYDELNKIGDHLSNAARRLGRFVEREHSFLRHASHELRTPITIISGSTSVMEKIATDDKQRKVTARIKRASHSMETIVATLLWLGREQEPNPDLEKVDLSTLLDEVIEDHKYLLCGKGVVLNVNLPALTIDAPRVPLSIIAANIIRNAFQHTQHGQIDISISPKDIVICNQAADLSEQESKIVFEESYGVGLSLIRRIARRLNWTFQIEQVGDHVTTRLTF
ncbi:Sensor histidine kinase GlrK [Pseudovibrio sp. Ad46]|uniref:sensor histidine kinase n=1 Tax=unclassified Pseudovibrio TaxID=2627060 RepID=UPI0007AE8AE4|nr:MULTISPECIES: HAMP domain-containing sensor histidine kinase [unclassified Pseudovibrio]KZK77216.1 Sensor histidine kinase GlrK [Pseudovibrio sp. Ad46]KZK89710.1 Sensor histidine kinase GlrK [Pseudovibrio sp. Ad5]